MVETKKWVSQREVNAAYDNWFALDGNGAYQQFWNFLGANSHNIAVNGWLMTDDAIHRLGMLLSPHYRAIIKAWKIQNAKGD